MRNFKDPLINPYLFGYRPSRGWLNRFGHWLDLKSVSHCFRLNTYRPGLAGHIKNILHFLAYYMFKVASELVLFLWRDAAWVHDGTLMELRLKSFSYEFKSFDWYPVGCQICGYVGSSEHLLGGEIDSSGEHGTFFCGCGAKEEFLQEG
jgi:hypothetical protein